MRKMRMMMTMHNLVWDILETENIEGRDLQQDPRELKKKVRVNEQRNKAWEALRGCINIFWRSSVPSNFKGQFSVKYCHLWTFAGCIYIIIHIYVWPLHQNSMFLCLWLAQGEYPEISMEAYHAISALIAEGVCPPQHWSANALQEAAQGGGGVNILGGFRNVEMWQWELWLVGKVGTGWWLF